jgi:peptide deformylase
MILPIVAYGDPVLRKKAEEIPADFPNLGEVVSNMFETMYKSSGVGLAAPQVGLSLRLFVIDGSPFGDDDKEAKDFRRVFVNPVILEEEGEKWSFNEGCLSIPGIREDVSRKPVIRVKYMDENFRPHEETFRGMPARIIQHEYDHIEGVLFIDHLSALKKRLLKNRLLDITKGKVDVDYRMKFPKR